jgi:hypothetical protein
MRNTVYHLKHATRAAVALGAMLFYVGAIGCATTTERGDLHRGPMVRTAPPRQKPATIATTGAGLPEYWGTPSSRPQQHGEPGPKPSRVLPATREPGLWASKAPDTDPTIVLLGVHMWAPDADEDVALAYHRCANAANNAKSIETLPKSQSIRACLAPLIIYKCIQALEHKRPKWIDAATLEKARKHMSNMSVVPCGGFTEEQLEYYLSPIINELIGGM